MESLPELLETMTKGAHFLSFDMYRGYPQRRLNPAMQDWFIFKYYVEYYRYIELPFGPGLAPWWFTYMIQTFTQELRLYGFRTLPYIDYYLVVPSPVGTMETKNHCASRRWRIESLMRYLGISRHPSKGEWNSATKVEHLGVTLDSERMRFLCYPCQSGEGRTDSQISSAKRVDEPTLGQCIFRTALLCNRREYIVGTLVGTILHSFPLL